MLVIQKVVTTTELFQKFFREVRANFIAISSLSPATSLAFESLYGNLRECETMATADHVNCNPNKSSRRAHVVRRLVRARNLIEEAYDQPLALADLAAAACMSEAHFVRQFHREFGVTPYRCLTQRRLTESKQLLAETTMPIADIVAAAGFGNRSAFSRLFKTHFGVSPQAWRINSRRRRPLVGKPRRLAPLAAAATLLLCVLGTSVAQEEAPPPRPPACASEEYRQFDFWLGTWEVTADGQVAGTNNISKHHDGCVIKENWTSTSPFTGSSLNIYDSARGVWHQTWTDSAGTLLQLEGGLEDGAMVLTGERPARDGNGMVTHRISWTPNADGTVRQQWQARREGETEWKALFDGLYRKKG